MLGLYLGSLAFGGILIGLSIFLGGGEHDFDKDLELGVDGDFDADLDADLDADFDVDADVDMDADVGGQLDIAKDFDLEMKGDAAAVWLPFLSMRFWTFGSAAFGFTGAVLHFMVPWTLALGFALAGLVGVGSGAAYLFRYLKQDTISAETGLRRFVGREAEVVLSVRPGGVGKVVIRAAEGDIELVARTRDERPLERGSTVLIANVKDGTADVTSLPNHPDVRQRAARPEVG